MSGTEQLLPAPEASSWVGWCCSYCGSPLETRGQVLFCAAEGRSFATQSGVHRLLPEERRREILPFLELYQRVRRDEGWKVEPGLPEVPPGHPRGRIWRARARRFRQALALAEACLGPGPWRVLEVGGGNCWAAARLLERGHRVAAVDVNLDPEDGLPAANRYLSEPALLPRAEAEMDALPLPARALDLVLAAGSLHYPPQPSRTLIELRRVTRKGGLLVVLDSPVYRRRADGEAMVARRLEEQRSRYRLGVSGEVQSGFFVLGDLPDLFRQAGWQLQAVGWPGTVRERVRDLLEIARHGRRTARFPILLGRRDG